MAKKKKSAYDKLYHRKAQAINREEMCDVYQTYEVKRDIHNKMMYDRVEAPFSDLYGGIDPRRRVEMADAGMVKEDRESMANLSSKPIHRQYPNNNFYSNPFLDDSELD